MIDMNAISGPWHTSSIKAIPVFDSMKFLTNGKKEKFRLCLLH